MKDYSKIKFFSGGLKGAETAFGENAEKWGVREETFSYPGHTLTREKNVTILSDEELKLGDVSMEIVSKRMGRRYTHADTIRKVIQVIFQMVNKGFQVIAVGTIMEDGTVKGGTGWAVELAKFFNRPVSVFDQETAGWYTWKDNAWEKDTPVISYDSFCGTGTRNLTEEGRKAIDDLFERSFG
ncbi:MAG: hypothetical protein JRE40_10960 [Deltaproteobacteria bacterium]|nr:hypothetical protein [Deltaproteobacteria bacterium]